MPSTFKESFTGSRLAMTGLLAGGALLAGTMLTASPADARDGHEERLIAVVDVIALLQEGLQSESFAPEREAQRDEITAVIEGVQGELTAIDQELAALEQEIRMLGQGNPESQQLIARYQARFQTRQQREGQAQQQIQALNIEFEASTAAAATEVYELIHRASDEIGAAEGYRYVMTQRTEDDLGDLELPNLATVTQQLLARPLLRGAEQHDITELVREKLDWVAYIPEGAEEDAVEADAESTEDAAAPAEGTGG